MRPDTLVFSTHVEVFLGGVERRVDSTRFLHACGGVSTV